MSPYFIADGKFDIKLAGFGMASNKQQVHRINFSVIDEKTQKEAIEEGLRAANQFFQQLISLDSQTNKIEQTKKLIKK